MKPDGRGATGAMPQPVRGQVIDGGFDVFTDLLQGVRGGLKLRLDAGHRAAQPHFGNVVHTGKIRPTIDTVTQAANIA